MELKDFDKLKISELGNFAISHEIRQVFKERDELYEALKAMLSLLESNILVRNTDRDSDHQHFLKEGLSLILAIKKSHEAIIKMESRRNQ